MRSSGEVRGLTYCYNRALNVSVVEMRQGLGFPEAVVTGRQYFKLGWGRGAGAVKDKNLFQ